MYWYEAVKASDVDVAIRKSATCTMYRLMNGNGFIQYHQNHRSCRNRDLEVVSKNDQYKLDGYDDWQALFCSEVSPEVLDHIHEATIGESTNPSNDTV